MLAIIDYGVGNLFSLHSSLNMIGVDSVITSDEKVLNDADRIILPGVGAFEDAIGKLRATGLEDVVKQQAKTGKPMMGICLGMQMMFDRSFEYGTHEGLGLIPGDVVDMTPDIPEGLKVPHIGWNALNMKQPDHPLFKNIQDGDFVYFVHSYYATKCDEYTLATTEYGAPLTACVARDNVIGCQFHPEKSGAIGLNILRAFCEM